jgi:hypothetical protein
MDLKLLADTLTTFLAPALPFLVTGGEEVVRQAGKKLSEEGLELAEKLWGKLWPKVEANPQAKGAADAVAGAPDEEDARGGLRFQLRKILEADPDLAAELDALIKAAGATPGQQAIVYGSGAIAQGRGAVAAGAGGTAVSGGVQGDLIIGDGGRAADE